eukprot:CAMPEP_0198567354 /NCGR_PEP_ID=MMETSP1462-20131121/104660_1 /TAXON_ID=1333877 /ORGANISM="Brandtodinium nutriculum, Strain RCC3387" /LENGTH=36 /DNA_ID= /DNA_START= /DNA_END= /DNA_ORIENTATION=
MAGIFAAPMPAGYAGRLSSAQTKINMSSALTGVSAF